MDTQEAGLYNTVILGAILLAAIILYFLYTIIRNQEMFRRVTREHIDAEVNMIENERLRIAWDLHDDLGPYISTIGHKVGIIHARGELELQLQNECLDQIDHLVAKLRQIAKSLLPYSLKERGPVIAIEEFIRELNNKRLNIKLEYKNIPDFSEMQSIHIYRMLQEIIHNSIKHASPGNLRIVLQVSGKNLLIKTADDGRGFGLTKDERTGKGIGIRIMKSRVSQLNGKMSIESGNGKGTRYFISIPLIT